MRARPTTATAALCALPLAQGGGGGHCLTHAIVRTPAPPIPRGWLWEPEWLPMPPWVQPGLR
eukprot:gene43746-32619_t